MRAGGAGELPRSCPGAAPVREGGSYAAQAWDNSVAMRKEEGSRSSELRELGWSTEDVRRYEDLWEYRQRWGAINLERDERAFLRRAEAALPIRLSGKAAQKKGLMEKAHVRWLAHFLTAMRADPAVAELAAGEEAAWVILLEEELRALAWYEPVLGLPDTLRARALVADREEWIAAAAAEGRPLSFDFAAALAQGQAEGNSTWKPLRGEERAGASDFPVLPAATAAAFRTRVRRELLERIRALPSLKDSEKGEPPDDWTP